MLTFKVRGSEGDIYKVAAEREGNNLAIRCTCPAGENNTHCKHRIALLNGDVSNLVGGNVGDVRLLGAMLVGTDVETALGEFHEREAELEEAQKRLRAAKKMLGRAMDDGPPTPNL